MARTSLRKVAKSAGVKVGATKKFIDGSVPYERNARLWKRWYLRELREERAEAPDDALPTAEALSALEMLLLPLAGAERSAALPRAVAAFAAIFHDLARTPPAWLLELSGNPPPRGSG